MQDFANWCLDKNLIDVFEDGTVVWKEEAVKGGKKVPGHSEKFKGARDMRKDLEDYVDYCRDMGTVWPFKVKAGKNAKPVAPVGK